MPIHLTVEAKVREGIQDRAFRPLSNSLPVRSSPQCDLLSTEDGWHLVGQESEKFWNSGWASGVFSSKDRHFLRQGAGTGIDVATIEIETLRRIFERYGPSLTLYARQWCVHPEDALQEALIELAKLDPEPPDPIAWLFKVVRFRAINLARAEGRREKHHQEAASRRPSWFHPNAAQPMESLELEMAIEQLHPIDREILIARIWGERSFEEIADLVGLGTSTVYRKYQQSLHTLGSRLRETDPR